MRTKTVIVPLSEAEEERAFTEGLLCRARHRGASFRLALDDPRFNEIVKIAKELNKESKAAESAKEDKRKEKTEESKRLANERLEILNQRIKAIGLDDLLATGVDTQSWGPDGGVSRVWVCFDGGKSLKSEDVANRIIDRLESIAGQDKRHD